MTPKDIHQRNAGDVEALPDGLRDMLLAGTGRAKQDGDDLPGVPKRKTHKTGRENRDWSQGHLSKRQKAEICVLAGEAYAIQKKYGMVPDGVTLDAWRRAEQLEAVKIASLKDCRQSHYKPLVGYFSAMANRREPVRNFKDMTTTPEDPYRASMARALREVLKDFEELRNDDGRPWDALQAEGYLFAIAQHRGRLIPRTVATILETWDPKKIEDLVTTMRNRLNAKRGVGDTRNRNKSQRRGPRP